MLKDVSIKDVSIKGVFAASDLSSVCSSTEMDLNRFGVCGWRCGCGWRCVGGVQGVGGRKRNDVCWVKTSFGEAPELSSSAV